MTRNMERRMAYAVAAVLLVAAVLFAALRSQGLGLVMARDGASPTATGDTPEERFEWFTGSNAIWEARCAGCHAELDYIPELFAADGGREYLLDFMLFGAQGEARIYGSLQNLHHRPFAGQFDDAEIAGLLNLMLVAWDNEESLPEDAVLYEAAEVAEARSREIPQADVLLNRPEYPQ